MPKIRKNMIHLSMNVIERNDEFHMFHRYRRLSARGIVEPLTHDNCGGEFYTSLDKDDELILVCSYCTTRVIPGTKLMDKVYKAVEREKEYEQT
jgi:hypothetical protein